MNDPHVSALVYRVKHDETVNYDKAIPLEYETAIFKVSVKSCEARFDMKEHFPTVEQAREVVEPFIRQWEFAAALDRDPRRVRTRVLRRGGRRPQTDAGRHCSRRCSHGLRRRRRTGIVTLPCEVRVENATAIFKRPRRPRAMCSSPRRVARGVIELT